MAKGQIVGFSIGFRRRPSVIRQIIQIRVRAIYNSTQLNLLLWQLWTHNKTQSIETQEHKNTEKRKNKHTHKKCRLDYLFKPRLHQIHVCSRLQVSRTSNLYPETSDSSM